MAETELPAYIAEETPIDEATLRRRYPELFIDFEVHPYPAWFQASIERPESRMAEQSPSTPDPVGYAPGPAGSASPGAPTTQSLGTPTIHMTAAPPT